MTEDIQPDVLRRTQESLGKFIKKPVLSEKLLRKPPFRFLHDICTAAMKETGFLEGTLSGNDVKIELITDKEGKIAFLQKVIAAVESANNVKLGVKPTKIVAGHEPMKTNEFLQSLADALEKQVEAKGAKKATIKKIKATDQKESDSAKRKNPTSQPSNKANEQPSTVQDKKDAKKKKENNKQAEKVVEEAKRRVSSQEKTGTKVKEKPKKKELLEGEKAVSGDKELVNGNGEIISNGDSDVNGLQESPKDVINVSLDDENKAEDGINEKHAARPISAKYKKRTQSARPRPDVTLATSEAQEVGQQSEVVDRVLGGVVNVNDPPAPSTPSPPAATPAANVPSASSAVLTSATARKPSTTESASSALLSETTGFPSAAPLTATTASDPVGGDGQLQNGVPAVRPRTAIRPPSARPASARPAAPRVRDRGQVPLQEQVIHPVGKVNLIVEQDVQQDDEELVSVQLAVQIDDDVTIEPSEKLRSGGEHGQLVNQILEAQKELEEDVFAKKAASGRTEIEWSSERGVEGTRREMERVRAAVQDLTRSANPLGKLLEFLQDDVDSMQQELKQWRDRNAQLQTKLEHERNLTDKSLEPMKTHLEELEESIRTELEQIGALKANVLRNDDNINRLLNCL